VMNGGSNIKLSFQLLMVTNETVLLCGIFNKFTTVILSLAVYPSGQ